MRGLIVWPGLIFDGESGHLEEPADQQQIRAWLLFWDRLALPWTGYIGVEWGSDVDYLIKRRIAKERNVPIHAGTKGVDLRESRFWLFEKLEEEGQGTWAIGTSSETDDATSTLPGRGLRVKLCNAVPVPNVDVPIDEVLSFKRKSRDEHLALMGHLDEAYLSVMSDPDRPVSEQVAFEKLAADLRSILRRTEEHGFTYRLMDIAADFNLVAAGVAASLSAGLGQHWSNIVGNSVLAGASVSIGKTVGIVKSTPSASPFRYVTSYNQKLFSGR